MFKREIIGCETKVRNSIPILKCPEVGYESFVYCISINMVSAEIKNKKVIIFLSVQSGHVSLVFACLWDFL